VPVHLREANLVRDEAALVGMTQTYMGATDGHRFRWLYRDGPFGPARVWLAFDGSSPSPLGMAALFPRRGYIGGEEVLGCVLGDFCISEHYRSLGPAIQLQRACLALIESGEFAFSYDFPSKSMLGVYRYMGVNPTDECVRLVKVLRAEDQVREMVAIPVIAKALTAAADFALRLSDKNPAMYDGMEYRLDNQPCSREYLRLAQRIGSSLGSCVLRSPEYLDWRYRRHPFRQYEFLTCHRNGELQAYCVFTLDDERVQIVDLFGSSEEKVLTGLLRCVVRLARNRGKSAISVALLASDPRTRVLRKLGFHSRESAPVVGFGPRVGDCGSKLLLMHGDRES
jgi:hypothetical protein